ncbi:MAG: EAL domain-containing protein [Oscillospiraceae bacterium]|nr:EAL domain-containing protein [Oscillospiraceae bacterium]
MSENFPKNLIGFLSAIKRGTNETRLIKKIRDGLENKEFKMHLQFIVDNRTKRIVSSEALSRWETSDGEVIMPGKYIGVMEKSGLITKFDYYMFENVCDKLSKWTDTDFDEITISCNFTRITISEKDFVTKIKDIAERYEFDRSKLIIEITEDSIEKNLDVARHNIIRAKELGFRIALDDIGGGYTSLISLCEYKIDMVKIDREVLLLSNEERGRKLFLGIISLIHKLNLKVVCEGVETEEQNALVSESECDYIQGWYYSKALPESEAENFAREYMKKY